MSRLLRWLLPGGVLEVLVVQPHAELGEVGVGGQQVDEVSAWQRGCEDRVQVAKHYGVQLRRSAMRVTDVPTPIFVYCFGIFVFI